MSDQLIESINRSKLLLHLTNIGIDIEAAKNAAVESVDENEIEPFANRSHQLLSVIISQYICRKFGL